MGPVRFGSVRFPGSRLRDTSKATATLFTQGVSTGYSEHSGGKVFLFLLADSHAHTVGLRTVRKEVSSLPLSVAFRPTPLPSAHFVRSFSRE